MEYSGSPEHWKNLPSVSIIIPTVNRSGGILPYVMQRIALLQYPVEKVEVILVNNRPEVTLQDFSDDLPFRYVCTGEKKKGRAAARNRGIEMARGKWLLFLDDDIIPEADVLLEHMTMHRDHPGSVVLGEIAPCPGTTILDRIHLLKTFRGQKHGEILEYGAITCNLSVRRQDIVDAGCFDSSFDLYGFEDLDLGYRLIYHGGLTLRYNRKAKGWHYRKLEKAEAVNNYYEAGISFVRFIRKHPSSLACGGSPVIGAHLRETLKEALSFSPFSPKEARRLMKRLEFLEERRAWDPDESELIDIYEQILRYSYNEGIFLSSRNLEGARRPLLSPESSGLPSHKGLSFLWQGLLNQFTGYGVAARMYYNALKKLGYRATSLDLEDLPGEGATFPFHKYHFFIHHFWKPSHAFPAGPYLIQYSAFETTMLPRQWISDYNRMHEIWVPSSFCRQAMLDSGIKVPVTVIPHGIDTAHFRPRNFYRHFLTDEQFCFMSIGEFWEHKGFDVLLRAYLEEFSPEEAVLLVMKLNIRQAHTGLEKRAMTDRFISSVKAKVKKKAYPPLFIYHSMLTEDEFPDFLNACDCYVCASRGEGFCLPLMEAMSLGKPVISTAFGGQMDYLTSRNAYLINYKRVRACSTMHPEHMQGEWAEPEVEHLRALMRNVYEKREEALLTGAQAKDDVLRKWNTATMAKIIARRVEEIYEEYWHSREHIFMGDPGE